MSKSSIKVDERVKKRTTEIMTHVKELGFSNYRDAGFSGDIATYELEAVCEILASIILSLEDANYEMKMKR